MRHSRIVGTPEAATAYYQELVEAGIQYFVVQSLEAVDKEAVRLLAEHVVPRVRA